MLTIIKFLEDSSRHSNKVYSKTFGKHAVIDREYKGPIPKHDEFWRVKIERELNAGCKNGLFVVNPIMKIATEKITKLVVGFYDYEIIDDICLVRPPEDKLDVDYIIPLTAKAKFNEMGAYATIVDLTTPDRGFFDRKKHIT